MHGTVCAPASSPSVYKGVPTDTPVIEGGRGVLAKLGLGNHMDLLRPPVDLQISIGHNFMHVNVYGEIICKAVHRVVPTDTQMMERDRRVVGLCAGFVPLVVPILNWSTFHPIMSNRVALIFT